MSILCELRDLEQYEPLLSPTGGRQKKGSYHGSYFWDIKGFGTTKWVLAAIIDSEKGPDEDMDPHEFIEGCIEHLNTPIGKRKKKRLYGNLELHKFSARDDGGYTVLLTTDERLNKSFWGKGQRVSSALRRK